MDAIKRFLTNWWTITIFILVLVVGVLCLLLPLFVGFLRPWWVRALCFLVPTLIWGIFAFLRVKKARDSSKAIADELASTSGQEGPELAKRMQEALASFKTESGNKGDYLYSRPWYVIIGPPGAGKTTALLNSGLRFPFSGQALKGIGGTRNLDFWFADEAVLIDTAGRYTSQDSNASKDANAWHSFLGLLKKTRPLQPVNGIFVAIGLDEIIKSDRATLDDHAAAVRRRLVEIRKSLEISVPVYVLFTKSDLMAGFTEFFDDLDVEGRRAVVGATLPFEAGRPDAGALTTAFDEVAQSIADRQAKRLAEDLDLRRRSLILGFPTQFAGLRARLMRFIDGAFMANEDPVGSLRGFYLTSGVQQGATLDRLLAGMGDVYEQPQASPPGGGRAYFLNRLLGEVVFPEAGLVQMTPEARLRMKSQLIMAISGIGVACLLMLVLWGVSFVQNRNLQNNLLAQSTAINATVKDHGIDLVQVGSSDADLEQAVDVLDSLRKMDRGYAARQKGGAPLFMTFGLFQEDHSKRAALMYQEGLRRILLPRVMLRLETFINAHMNDPIAIYEPLKVYLELGGQKPGAIDKASIKAWIESDWENDAYSGSDRADLRDRLGKHLEALIDDNNLTQSWPNATAPLDGNLIVSARSAVQTLSLSDRAYAILAQKAELSGGAPWLAANVLSSGDAVAFANGADVMALKVPYFFTRDGYERAYQPGLLTIQEDLKKDLWVLGSDANTESVQQQIAGIRPGVASLYAKNYEAAWDNVIAVMKPADYFNNVPAFSAFSRPLSPWKLLLLELRKNTSFKGGAAAGIGGVAASAASYNFAQGHPVLAKMVGASGSGGPEVDAGHEISTYFQPVQDYVGDGKAPAPIDDFLTSLRSAGQAIVAARAVGGGAGSDAVQAQTATATAGMAQAAAGAPAALSTFTAAAAKGGSAAETSAATGAVSQAYTSSIAMICQQTSQDKYPFFSASQVDVSALDALRVFGPGGTVDGFVTQKLTPLLDTSGPIWRWKAGDPVAQTLNPTSADALWRASQLRDMLTAGVPFKVQVVSFGPDVDGAEFSSGGATFALTPSTTDAKSVMWSIQGTPEAHLTLTKGGQQVSTFPGSGPWAIFHLMDAARVQNSGPGAFLATFGQGSKTVTLKIILDLTHNPFSHGGVWSFRCPVSL